MIPTDHDIAEVARIAKGLTTGESRAIQVADLAGYLPKHTGKNRLGRSQALTLPTIRNLQDAGLASSYPYHLTPLGLRVKAYLESNNAG